VTKINIRSVRYIHLRDVIETDLPIFFEHQREPAANQMADFPARSHEAFVAHWQKIQGDPTMILKAIIVNDHVAGSIGCWKMDNQHHVCYWIGMAYWGKGIVTAALGEFVKVVSERPLYARVAKHNLASIRVLEKCGFAACDEVTDRTREAVDDLLMQLGS